MSAKQKRNSGYIIESLLDLDFYKPVMGQFVFHRFRETPVEYALNNRTKNVQLSKVIDYRKLKRELDHVRTLRFTESDLDHFRQYKRTDGTNLFKEDYLEFLKGLVFPEYELHYKRGQLQLTFSGKWEETIYWETIALSIINELYYRAVVADMDATLEEGRRRLKEKIKFLLENPDISFIEFGTRRRFSRKWQEEVFATLLVSLPDGQLIGTSNVALAKRHGLLAKGTTAHELPMGLSGIMHGSEEEIRASHKQVFIEWAQEYAPDLLIALPDTYGHDAFFEDFTREMAELWAGVRQDSGDPIEFGDRLIEFYKSMGIDPTKKQLLPSDGLDLPLMRKIVDHFKGRIKVAFGWGTNLTNDLGVGALSLVIKLVKSCGHGTVKFSENLAKAMGSPEDLELFKRIFHNKTTAFFPTTY